MKKVDPIKQIPISLETAVRKDLELKAKLGQEAVVNRNGKPTRVKASELLKEDKK